jgi:hypothetical protein
MDPGRAKRANSAVSARNSTSTVVEATLEGEPGAELDFPFGAHSIEHSLTGVPKTQLLLRVCQARPLGRSRPPVSPLQFPGML